ncbi:Imm1 family immunity protein [Kitasatospora arboriphila]|uniref:Immunity protein Imm1 n=1 Tax=Kitasatospora arboriphila TaxID=258052 RepID=A0ABN1TG28_9ACTN
MTTRDGEGDETLRGTEAVFTEEHLEEHSGAPVLLDSAEAVDAMVDALIAGGPLRNTAHLISLDRPLLPSGRPDHEFLVGVRAGGQVGILSYSTGDEGALIPAGEATTPVATYMVVTYPREFLEPTEVPIGLVRQAVKEFVLSGGRRPTCLEWREEPY